MHKNVTLLIRIVGGVFVAMLLSQLAPSAQAFGLSATISSLIVAGLYVVGFAIGWVFAPRLIEGPIQKLDSLLKGIEMSKLLFGLIGVFIGLYVSNILSPTLNALPGPLGAFLPLISMALLSYIGASLLISRANDFTNAFKSLTGGLSENMVSFNGNGSKNGGKAAEDNTQILLDTSVIIDGRITDISKTGFLRGTLLVPHFILDELQHIADSSDVIRRNRGRRGLDVLNILQKESPIPVQITDMDVSETRAPDSKLVALGKELHCPIMTNDYNLNRVAELQGVSVLNINDLANAVKSAFLPGEQLVVKVIQEGKEAGQGVGYLEDGTMVVVEDGVSHLNQTLQTVVTKVLQTTAGRMVFARAHDDMGEATAVG